MVVVVVVQMTWCRGCEKICCCGDYCDCVHRDLVEMMIALKRSGSGSCCGDCCVKIHRHRVVVVVDLLRMIGSFGRIVLIGQNW